MLVIHNGGEQSEIQGLLVIHNGGEQSEIQGLLVMHNGGEQSEIQGMLLVTQWRGIVRNQWNVAGCTMEVKSKKIKEMLLVIQ